MRFALALALLATFLVAAPAARADVPVTAADVASYQAVADRVAPGHCAGRARAIFVDQIAPDAGQAPGLVTKGRAIGVTDGSCDFLITRGDTRYDTCVIIVHERMHLEGFRSSDPATAPDGTLDHQHDRGDTIMNPQAPDVLAGGRYKPCNDAVEPLLTREAAFNRIEDRWHMQSLDCRRELLSRHRCWGTTQMGKRAKFVAWMDGDYHVNVERLGRKARR